MGKTWENIKSFDEILTKEEKGIISDLEKEAKAKCPFLRKEGKFFYYCGVCLEENIEKEVSFTSPIFQNHVNVVELQLYCMAHYKVCSFYKKFYKTA